MRHHIDSDRTVTINREKLVAQLKSNRELHKKIYEEALEGYEEELREKLVVLGEQLVHIAAEGDCDLHAHWGNIQKEELNAALKLQKPQNALDSYDDAIALFEWDETPSVELTVAEFRRYVLDKWDWQEKYLMSNEGYSTTARAIRRRRRSG